MRLETKHEFGSPLILGWGSCLPVATQDVVAKYLIFPLFTYFF